MMRKFLNYLNQGFFFSWPLRILYIFTGVISLITMLFLGIYGVMRVPQALHFDYIEEGWSKFTAYLALGLICLYLIFLGVLALLFWIEKYKEVKLFVRPGDKIIGLNIFAHYIQASGESNGISTFLGLVGFFWIFFIFSLFSGFKVFFQFGWDMSMFLKAFFIGLIVGLVFTLLVFIASYLIILTSRVAAEKLRVKAMVANDLSDVADIQRAGVI